MSCKLNIKKVGFPISPPIRRHLAGFSPRTSKVMYFRDYLVVGLSQLPSVIMDYLEEN